MRVKLRGCFWSGFVWRPDGLDEEEKEAYWGENVKGGGGAVGEV
jgi:hypothetical protein